MYGAPDATEADFDSSRKLDFLGPRTSRPSPVITVVIAAIAFHGDGRDVHGPRSAAKSSREGSDSLSVLVGDELRNPRVELAEYASIVARHLRHVGQAVMLRNE